METTLQSKMLKNFKVDRGSSNLTMSPLVLKRTADCQTSGATSEQRSTSLPNIIITSTGETYSSEQASHGGSVSRRRKKSSEAGVKLPHLHNSVPGILVTERLVRKGADREPTKLSSTNFKSKRYHRKTLCLPAPKDLVEELYEINEKWYDIGLQLGLSHETLIELEKKYDGDSSICIIHVAEIWLKETIFPSWYDVVDMLKSKTIDEKGMALRIIREYL